MANDPIPDRDTPVSPAPAVFPNSMTDAQLARLLAQIEGNRQNPDFAAFIERGRGGIAEYRQQIQDEWEREMAEQEKRK